MSTNSTAVSPLKWIQWHVYEGDNDYGYNDQTALQVNFGKGESSFLRLRFTYYDDELLDTNAKPNAKKDITLFKEDTYFHAVVTVIVGKINYVQFELTDLKTLFFVFKYNKFFDIARQKNSIFYK